MLKNLRFLKNTKNLQNSMFTVRLAELNITINNKFEYIKKLCADYIVDAKADFIVEVTDAEIEAERECENNDKGYLEALAIYRKIAEKITEYNGFLMHGAVISVDDCGIAFLAKSGTGKTTHINLWSKLLKNKVTVINGDKPLVRVIDGKIYAYGTPWAGKEGLNSNTKTELKNICFLSQSLVNECLCITDSEMILEKLLSQIYLPKSSQGLEETLSILNIIMDKCRFYSIKCNTDVRAAEIAYKAILLFRK